MSRDVQLWTLGADDQVGDRGAVVFVRTFAFADSPSLRLRVHCDKDGTGIVGLGGGHPDGASVETTIRRFLARAEEPVAVQVQGGGIPAHDTDRVINHTNSCRMA